MRVCLADVMTFTILATWDVSHNGHARKNLQESDQFYIMDAGSKWGTFLKISLAPAGLGLL